VEVSHFSSVGFEIDFQNPAWMSALTHEYLPKCTASSLSPRDMVCLVKDPSGSELRLALRKGTKNAAELVTLNPGFDGESRVEVDIAADVSDPDWKPFEVAMTARFRGEETPLVFDLADPAEAASLVPGAKVTLEIAAFSYAPSLFANEAAYIKSQDGRQLYYAADFFIPSGMYKASVGGLIPEGSKLPKAYADFAGTVLKAEFRTNAAGGGKFWWALVRTYGGSTLDVVIDPTTIPGAPEVGSILSGRFWLSARLAR